MWQILSIGICHIYRESNRAADYISKWDNLGDPKIRYYVGSISKDLLTIVEEDALGTLYSYFKKYKRGFA